MTDSIRSIRPVPPIEPVSSTRRVRPKEGDSQDSSKKPSWRDVLEESNQKQQHRSPEKENQESPKTSKLPPLVQEDLDAIDEYALLEQVVSHPEELLHSYKESDYEPPSPGKWVDSVG